jgi:hypothetical protein
VKTTQQTKKLSKQRIYVRCIWFTSYKSNLSCYLHAGDKGERGYSSYSFLNSALDWWVTGQHHGPAMLYPQERTPSAHWRGGWVGLRVGLDTEARGKILILCRGSNPGCPVCSQAQYSLSYPSSSHLILLYITHNNLVRWKYTITSRRCSFLVFCYVWVPSEFYYHAAELGI